MDHPDSHAVHAFLGEIYYRTRHLEAARDEFLAAVRIKPDYMEGYRYAGVIDLLDHDPAAALTDIRRGLQVAPDDVELNYLAARARSADASRALKLATKAGPAAVEALAGIAFEVGDLRGVDETLAAGLARWPGHRAFVDKRAKLAVAMGRVPARTRPSVMDSMARRHDGYDGYDGYLGTRTLARRTPRAHVAMSARSGHKD